MYLSNVFTRFFCLYCERVLTPAGISSGYFQNCLCLENKQASLFAIIRFVPSSFFLKQPWYIQVIFLFILLVLNKINSFMSEFNRLRQFFRFVFSFQKAKAACCCRVQKKHFFLNSDNSEGQFFFVD